MRRRILAAVMALSCAPLALGQGGPARNRARLGPEGGPREDIFKMVEAWVISNLQESLGLTDEQFVKLLPLVKRLQTDRRMLAQRRIQTIGALRRALDQPNVADAQIADLLKELKSVEAEEPATIRKDLEAVDAALTPIQQAKYRVLEVEVERRLRDLVSEVRRNAQPREPQREQQ